MTKSNKRAWLMGILASIGSLVILPCAVRAQYASPQSGQVDIFMGAELHYRDVRFGRMYEVLVNLTPGVKWNLGKQWQVAAQALLPVYNDYGGYYSRVRLNMAVLSKEMYIGDRHFLKLSGGLFSTHRYGWDVKYLCPIFTWLALEGQAGWTGLCDMNRGWKASPPQRWTALAGMDFYIPCWNAEIRARGGRFIYEDYGCQFEGMRHFRHCTVGVYVDYSNKASDTDGLKGGWNGGFKVVMMIPPYRRNHHKVNIRPASNFRFTYNLDADPYTNLMYTTDPEENERERWFDRNRLRWGANTMEPDFVEKGGKP